MVVCRGVPDNAGRAERGDAEPLRNPACHYVSNDGASGFGDNPNGFYAFDIIPFQKSRSENSHREVLVANDTDNRIPAYSPGGAYADLGSSGNPYLLDDRAGAVEVNSGSKSSNGAVAHGDPYGRWRGADCDGVYARIAGRCDGAADCESREVESDVAGFDGEASPAPRKGDVGREPVGAGFSDGLALGDRAGFSLLSVGERGQSACR